MIGKQAAARPTALGTLLSSGVYGSVLTQAYGTPRLSPMPIWAGNLRKGASSKKAKKKGMPTYVEDIDLFVATNPFSTVLQIWSNQKNAYPLNFVDYVFTQSGGTGGWASSITIPDPYFYAVCAVGLEVALRADCTFDDYGAPGPVTYFKDTPGFGATNIYIIPLWNAAQHGPDLSDPYISRYPCYYWTPADANVVNVSIQNVLARLSSYAILPNPTGFDAPFATVIGTVHIYYAQTTPTTKRQPPLLYNRFVLEPRLGDGPEYADAGEPGQQIIYPEYAGIGSTHMDLGTSGAVPSWRLEAQASYGFLPSVLGDGARADVEFADVVEDLIKSGLVQYGQALGYTARGLNCNDLPNVVQKNYFDHAAFAEATVPYYQPNSPGSILLAACKGSPGFGTADISDDAANTWVPDYVSGDGSKPIGIWHVLGANAFPGVNTVTMNTNGPGASDAMVLELDPGSDALDGPPVVVDGGGLLTASIDTSGEPSYVIALVVTIGGVTYPTPVPPQWQQLFSPNAAISPAIGVWGRRVSQPSTISFTAQAEGGTNGVLALYAFKSAQAAGTVPYAKKLPNILDYGTLFNARQACRCGGLQGSLAMDSQQPGTKWLEDLYTCMNAWPVWSGFRLKSVARSEVSQVGDGSAADTDIATPSFAGLAGLYVAPTAAGPVVDLTEDCLVGSEGEPLITVERKGLVDADNIFQVQHVDRNNKYNQAVTEQPEAATIALYGPRKGDPRVLNMIVDPQVARKVGAIEVRRKTQLLNVYKLKAKARFFFLEATDLVTINDHLLGISKLPVRLTRVAEDPKTHELALEAEPFIYGLHAPNLGLTTQPTTPYDPNIAAIPAPVNPPIFLEPPTAMTINNALELWVGVSDADPDYGGCNVFVSTDGGANYNELGSIIGSAVTGVLTADWPAGLDPDTTNDLSLDLGESLGALESYSVADLNNFVYPFYVEGATTCGYELGAYSTATLTGPHQYTLPASPNGLRRDVYHQPLGGSVDHPAGKRFLFLGAASAASSKTSAKGGTASGASILKLPLSPIWEGQTLYFKFQAFNIFGGGVQDLSDCVPYPYVPGSCAVLPAGDIVSIAVTSPAPGDFTVAHGLLFTPLFAVVQMTSDGMIVLQRPVSVDATNVYLTASDAGLTANVIFFSAPADASVALAPAAAGAFSVPHGLAAAPTLGIVQLDSLGDIWRGAPPYTSTDLNLVASDGGLTGKDYAWVTPPTTPTLTRFTAVALAPSAGGNFSVAHGLGVVPKLVIVRMTSGGAIWLQSSLGADATNLLLTASDGGITGEAAVWA